MSVISWRLFFSFCFLFSWIFDMAVTAAGNTRIPVNVGVVVNLDAPSGKIYLSCIKMALEDFYASHAHYRTRLVLNTRNSKENIVGAAAAALDLIKNVEVQAILGPETSMQASFVVNLGDQAHVPILSFSATSPSLASFRSSYFFQITQTDSYQVKAIGDLVKYFGWRQVVPIYVDDTYGDGVIPSLIDALQEVDAHVPYRSVIPPSATDDQIGEELYKLMTMQTRVFIVHMMPNLSSSLFSKAKEIGMMSEGYVWIMTNGVGNSLWSMRPILQNAMQGVLGVETDVPKTVELNEFKIRWRRQFEQDNPTMNVIDVDCDAFALQAYDAAFALALAIEELGINTSFGFQKMNDSLTSTDLDTFKVSQHGLKLAQALSATRFKGIAGDFSLVDGQLQSSNFRIVNVNGDGVRRIAFWTPETGMVHKLNSRNMNTLSTSKNYNPRPVIWPGDSLSVPKGCEIPRKGKKLRIGVPVKVGYTEFVKVTKNPGTNTTEVTGFSIDVFKAVLGVLPYALPYEFVPFENPDGTSAGTYNDLVYQVHLENFDAVVGDTTIRANRSLYVDFTMPYTKSGVMMVVPIRDTRNKNAWVFLKPLTWDLWLTTFCFFIFIGFVIWVLEDRIVEDFRGPPSHQVGTSFWFSFALFFSHREKVVCNLDRFLMIIWVFIVLVLTQSYTANLASLLTVQQLQTTATDVKDLVKSGVYVGYMQDSFVYELLKQIGFAESKLKAINSMEESDEALSKGSGKGGIAALIDEAPNMKLFVAKYCSKYMMLGPIFKTDGFGFVFPKRSPLLCDVSQAVLKVTEGEKIMKIESKWFSQGSYCEAKPKVSSNSLGLESFWGLFLVAGVASILALAIFAVSFLYNNRHILKHAEYSGASKWKRVRAMFEIFLYKDPGSHNFKSSQQRDGSAGVPDQVKASPNSNWPGSPFSYFNLTDKDFDFYEGQQSPSTTTSHAPTETTPDTT